MGSVGLHPTSEPIAILYRVSRKCVRTYMVHRDEGWGVIMHVGNRESFLFSDLILKFPGIWYSTWQQSKKSA